MINTPPVTCVCLTYGRPAHILEESIECFLKQDYAGEKEMLILNDYDKQTYEYIHPQVKIVNMNKRFKTVGEKRNASVALATHDIIFIWDDDDIFLPNRLSYSMKMFDEAKGYFKPSRAFILDNGSLRGPTGNLYHSGGCWYRKMFDEVGGYGHINSGQDYNLEVKFEKHLKAKGFSKNYNDIKMDDMFYLYRWAGTGTFHLSAFGKDKKDDKKCGSQKVEEYVASRTDIPTGLIKLNPHWNIDYVSLARNFVKTLVPPPSSSSSSSME